MVDFPDELTPMTMMMRAGVSGIGQAPGHVAWRFSTIPGGYDSEFFRYTTSVEAGIVVSSRPRSHAPGAWAKRQESRKDVCMSTADIGLIGLAVMGSNL